MTDRASFSVEMEDIRTKISGTQRSSYRHFIVPVKRVCPGGGTNETMPDVFRKQPVYSEVREPRWKMYYAGKRGMVPDKN